MWPVLLIILKISHHSQWHNNLQRHSQERVNRTSSASGWLPLCEHDVQTTGDARTSTNPPSTTLEMGQQMDKTNTVGVKMFRFADGAGEPETCTRTTRGGTPGSMQVGHVEHLATPRPQEWSAFAPLRPELANALPQEMPIMRGHFLLRTKNTDFFVTGVLDGFVPPLPPVCRSGNYRVLSGPEPCATRSSPELTHTSRGRANKLRGFCTVGIRVNNVSCSRVTSAPTCLPRSLGFRLVHPKTRILWNPLGKDDSPFHTTASSFTILATLMNLDAFLTPPLFQT